MNIRSKQIAAVLALTGVYVGLWAAAWPRRFYDSFPGLGRHWVLALAPPLVALLLAPTRGSRETRSRTR